MIKCRQGGSRFSLAQRSEVRVNNQQEAGQLPNSCGTCASGAVRRHIFVVVVLLSPPFLISRDSVRGRRWEEVLGAPCAAPPLVAAQPRPPLCRPSADPGVRPAGCVLCAFPRPGGCGSSLSGFLLRLCERCYFHLLEFLKITTVLMLVPQVWLYLPLWFGTEGETWNVLGSQEMVPEAVGGPRALLGGPYKCRVLGTPRPSVGPSQIRLCLYL